MFNYSHGFIGKPKIHLRLAGGLGNQLFQISAASYLSREFSLPVYVYVNSLQSYEVKRGFDSARLFDLNCIHNLSLKEHQWYDLALHKIRIGKWMPIIGVNDKNFYQFHSIQSSIISSLFLDGYFMQSWTQNSLLAAIDPFLKHSIPSNCSFPKLSLMDRYAAIHIRGTDFLRTSNDLCGPEFYHQAINKAINLGYTNFHILTDDKEYSSQLLKNLSFPFADTEIKFFFVQGTSNIINDFWTLSKASLRISGNSTFAFWAALIANPDSITISCSSFSSTKLKPFKLCNEYWLI